jgi:hypothetical protein
MTMFISLRRCSPNPSSSFPFPDCLILHIGLLASIELQQLNSAMAQSKGGNDPSTVFYGALGFERFEQIPVRPIKP